VIEDLRRLFDTLAKPGHAFVWAELVCAVADFNALELLPEARRAFVEDLVDESIIGLEDVDPDAPRGPRRFPRPSGEQLFSSFLERNTTIDAVAECGMWICFRDDRNANRDWESLDEDEDESSEAILDALREPPPHLPPAVPFVAPPKVGRNDPCPCGSGKKYKKCCGKN
jgi:hypothetical protein